MKTPSITESDDVLAGHLEQADLPSLLPALAQLTGDFSLIDPAFAPMPPSPIADSLPQGGLTRETQDRARRAALDALRRYRDAGCPPARPMSVEEQLRLIRFVAGDVPVDYLSILTHELGLADAEGGDSHWSVAEVDAPADFSVVVIGAGMSGLAMSRRLADAGVEHVVLEKNAEVGGTWWENRYPGCRLDTSNFAYSYSWAQKADWGYQFSPRDEISEYFVDIAERYRLRDRIRFEVEVTSAEYDEATARWTVSCRQPDGSTYQLVANVVITAVGQLNRPSIPDLDGRDRFAGPAFHTAEWRDDVDLAGKRVAVVGTGASAYQVIPQIAHEVETLTIFQRTAPWMMPTPHYHDEIPSGLRWLFVRVPGYARWFRFLQFWNSLEGRRQFMMVDPEWTTPGAVSELNAQVRKALTQHLEEQYGDRPDLLAKVMPTYPPYAKRMLRDNGDWARTLKMDHVELVTDAIAELTPDGILTADGSLHEVDVIIWGTGFAASDFLRPITIRGVGGRDLHEWWDGEARAYLGITMPGFPNLFCIYGPNTNLVLNGSIILFSEAAVHYVMGCLERLLRSGAGSLECRQDVFDEYNDQIDVANLEMAWSAPGVNSWYKSASGRVSQNWPLPIIEYWRRTRRPNDEDFHVRATGA